MKKIIIIALVLSGGLTQAQNNTFPTTGNVGIGTTSPSSKLHVVGNSYTSGTVTSNGDFTTNGHSFVFGGNIYLGGTLGTIDGYNIQPIAIRSDGMNKVLVSNSTYTDFLEGYSGLTTGRRIRIDGSTSTISATYETSGSYYPLNFSTSNTNRMTILADGKVGIGKTNPAYLLDVNGAVNATELYVNGNAVLGGTSLAGSFGTSKVLQIQGGAEGTWISMTQPSGSFSISNGSSGTGMYSWGGPINFWTSSSGIGSKRMTIGADGNVGIGTSIPDEKLTVKGKIHTQEVKVDVSVPGPDYVFEEKYKLLTLAEIEAYVKQNKHLPEVPSAKEMEQNGILVGEMNLLLLKKVEELTLYMIALEKKVAELQNQKK